MSPLNGEIAQLLGWLAMIARSDPFESHGRESCLPLSVTESLRRQTLLLRKRPRLNRRKKLDYRCPAGLWLTGLRTPYNVPSVEVDRLLETVVYG